jgi:hypothetical protein
MEFIIENGMYYKKLEDGTKVRCSKTEYLNSKKESKYSWTFEEGNPVTENGQDFKEEE